MTMEADLSAAFTAVGEEIKAVRTEIAAIGEPQRVFLSAGVTNNSATANTLQDVTGLSFPVVAGTRYWFKFLIPYTAAATTTGSRWSINGPTSTQLSYVSRYTLTATSQTINFSSAYNNPSAANATSLTAGNIAEIEGIVNIAANGSVIARFASEVANSAITAQPGAFVEYRVLS